MVFSLSSLYFLGMEICLHIGGVRGLGSICSNFFLALGLGSCEVECEKWMNFIRILVCNG